MGAENKWKPIATSESWSWYLCMSNRIRCHSQMAVCTTPSRPNPTQKNNTHCPHTPGIYTPHFTLHSHDEQPTNIHCLSASFCRCAAPMAWTYAYLRYSRTFGERPHSKCIAFGCYYLQCHFFTVSLVGGRE